MTLLSLRGVVRRFGTTTVLHGVDLDVAEREVVCLIGASGSGKSTLLRCVNFLEPYDEGEVRLAGELVGWRDGPPPRRRAPAASLRKLRRGVGMVFQQFNLWPHMTARGNVAEPLVQVAGASRAEAETRAEALLDRVGLRPHADAYPARLSGGQQQRVAIARALALNPRLMLFDEPTSALDPELVGEVLSVMRDLATSGMTMLVVTHEMGFAAHAAGRVAFLAGGRIAALGPAREMLREPAEPRLKRFLQTYHERNDI